MSTPVQDLQSLFQGNQQTGLSQNSVNLFVQNLNGQAGLGCVGAQVDDLNTDDVTLVSVIIDQSSSMSSVKDAVIDSFNEMVRALNDSKAADSILLSCWTFDDNPNLLFGYTPIDQVKDLTAKTYQPHGITALYDAVLDGFIGLVGYGQDLRDNGIRTRCIVIVISDGWDNASKQTPTAVKNVADDLLKQEFYTLAFVGFGDAKDFNQIAQSLGFPSVLTAQHTPSEIRKTLNLISKSIIRTSQATVSPNPNGFFNF